MGMLWQMTFVLAYGILCAYWGYRAGRAEGDNEFQPTQETWLELEKFRWTHKYNSED